MRISDTVFESHLNCEYKGYLKMIEKKGEITFFETFDKERLSEYKEGYLNNLSSGLNILDCSGMKIFDTKTLVIGFDYLLNVKIENNFSSIRLDALKKIEKKSYLGDFSYIPILILPYSKILLKERLLLSYKSLSIVSLLKSEPDFGTIIFSELFKSRRVSFEEKLKSETQKTINRLLEISNRNKLPDIILNKHCEICEFQNFCLNKAREENNLSLLRNISKKEILKLKNKGIFTVNQLSYTFRMRRKKKKLKNPIKRHFRALKALAIRENKIYVYQIPELQNDRGKIYLDVEGDPDKNFYYLIGLIVDDDISSKKYSIWINDESEVDEKITLFLDIICSYENYTIYHYGNYEKKFFNYLKKFSENMSTSEIALMENSVNVLSYLYAHLYFPTYSNGLKEIANYLKFYWSEPNPSGLKSIYWRRQWDITHENKLKNKLILYNYEDCLALRKLTQFLIALTQDDNLNNQLYPSLNLTDNFDNIILDTYKGFPLKKNNFALKDFEFINKCAYVNYQLEKLHITSRNKFKRSKKSNSIKIKNKANKQINCRKSQRCLFCKSENLYQINPIRSKKCIDLKFFDGGIKKWIVKYNAKYQQCNDCGKSFFPTRYRNIGVKYEHNLICWVIYQNVANLLSFGKIEKTLADCFKISIGTVGNYNSTRFKNIAYSYYTPTYNRILSKIKNGGIINADETKIRTKGEVGYVWVFRNLEEVYFLFTESRKADFIQDLIGNFRGVLISDYYPGYDYLKCKKQKCLIHLMRDINNDLFKNQLDEEFKLLSSLFASLLRKIIDTIDRYGSKKRHLSKHNKDVDKFYSKIEISFDSEICIKLKKRLVKHRENLFTFLNYDGVPWNNNLAEHAFRHFAKYRQSYNGFNSISGIKKFLVFLSIYETCNNKNINFLKFLLSKEKYIENFSKKYTPSGIKKKIKKKTLMDLGQSQVQIPPESNKYIDLVLS